MTMRQDLKVMISRFEKAGYFVESYRPDRTKLYQLTRLHAAAGSKATGHWVPVNPCHLPAARFLEFLNGFEEGIALRSREKAERVNARRYRKSR